MTKSNITDERITSVIERLEHFASNLKWTDVRGAQDLLTAADGLRELQERRKADSEPLVPVVDADDNFYSWFGREWHENYQHNQYTTAAKKMLGVMAESAWKAGRCSAMLQAGDTVRDLSTPVDPQVAEYEQNVMQNGNSPVIPDGYVMVPMRLTAENGAKGALSGEFSETKFVNCTECFGDDECETCDGSGGIEIKVPVSWTTIKEIWAKGVEHFSAAPRQE